MGREEGGGEIGAVRSRGGVERKGVRWGPDEEGAGEGGGGSELKHLDDGLGEHENAFKGEGSWFGTR